MGKKFIVEIYDDDGNNPGIAFEFVSISEAMGFVETCLNAYKDKINNKLCAVLTLKGE